ncbi:hypothetical protein NL676_004829 [Syzygium grande]|nr:hypothetical protein NL676_004829 [Syzygium grande]
MFTPQEEGVVDEGEEHCSCTARVAPPLGSIGMVMDGGDSADKVSPLEKEDERRYYLLLWSYVGIFYYGGAVSYMQFFSR